jgi:branched-chain amino acid transport system permease protein
MRIGGGRWLSPLLLAALFAITVVPSWLGVYSGYIQFILLLIGINIILTVSLNLINGHMGEFSVGHAGFMGVGAYTASVLTVLLVIQDDVFGPPLVAEIWSVLVFPLSLIAGGMAASLFGLLVAIPSFRTRGDYLAIITLAVNFIFKSLIENLEVIGGPRGFMGMRRVTNVMEAVLDVPWTMLWTFAAALLAVYLIRNFVSSTFGKSVIAIREDEIAAQLMTVNTRRVKVVAFMLSCGLAGVAGGLFAHVLGYVNPSTFTILKSTEIMVMVYLGGMGSISGSVLSATGFTVLLELLRPLGLFRWVAIPLLLILLMLFRPTGLMGNRELSDVFPRLRALFGRPEDRLRHVAAAD